MSHCTTRDRSWLESAYLVELCHDLGPFLEPIDRLLDIRALVQEEAVVDLNLRLASFDRLGEERVCRMSSVESVLPKHSILKTANKQDVPVLASPKFSTM